MNWQQSIKEIKGISDKRSKDFAQMHIHTIDDLIKNYPRTYEANLSVTSITQLQVDQVQVIEVELVQKVQNIKKGAMTMTTSKGKDNSGEVFLTWFNQPYLKNTLNSTQKYKLKGKVEFKFGKMQMTSPEFVKEETEAYQLPVYRLNRNINQNLIRKMVKQVLQLIEPKKEYLPDWIRKEKGLCELNFALGQIHYPSSEHALALSIKRLKFDEFFFFQLGMARIKGVAKRTVNPFELPEDTWVRKFVETLPYTLTNAQTRTYQQVIQDMNGVHLMNRLIQGDVGSGKTVIGAIALIKVIENGYQGCMMAPTEVLAKQHMESLSQMMSPFGIQVGLLTGSLTKKQKLALYEDISSGKIQCIIGTHALIQEGVRFSRLGLVITDEQHRFGVKQREALSKKGQTPHVVVMSATPIPRTLALIVYGDMDVSIIDELPPGRQKILTYAVDTMYRERMYVFIEKEISQGRQVYMICPAIEENEESDIQLENVENYYEKLRLRMPEPIRIATLHGKMSNKEKNLIMSQFANHEMDILIATTVIEVGINVPNATLMVVENAERFGLAQLHQLRGRVGRGKHQSYCILVTDSKNEITKERMKIMKESTDGFVISEYDLKLRGPGDILGLRQSGFPEFKLGSVLDDLDLIQEVTSIVKHLLEEDPGLNKEEHIYLRDEIDRYFSEHVNTIII